MHVHIYYVRVIIIKRLLSRYSLQVYIDEIEEHRPFVEVVMATEGFRLEHSRRSEHEGISERVRDVTERFENLEGSERVRINIQ